MFERTTLNAVKGTLGTEGRISLDGSVAQGICKLCREERELQNSHIISKFLWKFCGLTGDKKRFDVTCTSHPELTQKHLQDGFKEPLLCRGCEQKRHRYEDAARRQIYTALKKLDPDQDPRVLEGLNYRDCKLFIMFQLWMMGVSSLPFFAGVSLGAHEEFLRQMLLDENPGHAWQYGTTFGILNRPGRPLLGIMGQPDKIRLRGRFAYRYVIAGVHSFTFVGSHPPPLLAEERFLFLQENGVWPVCEDAVSNHPYLVRRIPRA